MYAHRGGAALRPENTIASFDNGLSLGADGLELDVHLSRDGVVVVHHDPTLERTTSGRGKVSALTADELAQLDAAYWFTPAAEGTWRPAASVTRRGTRAVLHYGGDSTAAPGLAFDFTAKLTLL